MARSGRLVLLGRVRGHRGGSGEITVRVTFGDAAFWVGITRVVMEQGERKSTPFRVDASRAYRDRLVLKLLGVDDPGAAAGLRGATVSVEAEHAHEQAAGRFHPVLLVGLVAVDDAGQELGPVVGLERTQGSPLLVIERHAERGPARELLMPAAAQLVGTIDERAGTVVVRPPAGLLDLDTEEGPAE